MAARMPADSSRQTQIPCGVCSTVPPTSNDQFCRKCGARLSLECSHCSAAIRVQDKFCPSCGHRRIAIFDIFRYGLRVRTPAAIVVTAIVAGSAWLLLRYALRNKL